MHTTKLDWRGISIYALFAYIAGLLHSSSPEQETLLVVKQV